MDVLHEKLTKIKEIRYRMKKIMFNDRYGLTKAVIEGRKTMTRRLEFDDELQKIIADSDSYYYDDGYLVFATQGVDIHHVKTRYKIGELIAIAESYFYVRNIVVGQEYDDRLCKAYRIEHTDDVVKLAGWSNKEFVRSDLMPHQIRITGIKCERLQDISDAECMKEGVVGGIIGYYVPGIKCKDWSKESYVDTEDGRTWKLFPTPREAFASLIDKVSGLGAWQRNPWVVAYEFELVK